MSAANERRVSLEISEFEPSPERSGEKIDERQAAVARAIVRGSGTIEEILTEYSVSDDEITSWVLDGRFTQYAESLARAFAEMNAPRVWASLVDEAVEGKVPAIRLYLEVWEKNHRATGASAPALLTCAPSDIEELREDIFGGES